MADSTTSHAVWAEELTDEELAATLEHTARLAHKDATFYAVVQAAQRLRKYSNPS